MSKLDTRTAKPPRLARWLLRRWLPEEQREFILGDLEEDFYEVALPQAGICWARRWYWRHALYALVEARFEFRQSSQKTTERGSGMMQNIRQDLRYGLRLLARNPGFTVVVMLTLALGIGVNTTLFSVVNSVLLQPLPYPNPEQLVFLYERQGDQCETCPFSLPDFRDYREQNRTFSEMAGYYGNVVNLTLTEVGEPARVAAYAVTEGYFQLFGMAAARGRTFAPEEYQRGNDAVLVLSHGFWQRMFGGDEGVIGTTITLDDEPHTVLGILPAVPLIPSRADLWVPYTPSPAQAAARGGHVLRAMGRLKPGVSLEQARQDLAAIDRRIDEVHGENDHTAWFKPLHEAVVGPVRPALLVLMTAAGFVLLVACANVANLLLVRFLGRRREIAIRSALGAGRLRLTQQLLTESSFLAVLGGGGGLMLAYAGVELLKLLDPGVIPSLKPVQVDGRVLLFAAAVAVATAVVFSLVPLLHLSKLNLGQSLREGGRQPQAGPRAALRSLLVVAEVALCLVLVIGASLLLQSFLRLQDQSPGFETEQAVVLQLSLPHSRYANTSQRWAFLDQLEQRLRQLPGVEAVGTANSMPFVRGTRSYRVWLEGRLGWDPREHPLVQWAAVSPAYFRAMGIPLQQGRLFETSGVSGNTLEAVVSRRMAEQFFPGESPIGKRFSPGQEGPWMRIVGVVGNVKLYSLAAEPYPMAYVPYSVVSDPAILVVIRADSDPPGLVELARQQVAALDADLPVYGIQTLEQSLSESLARPRFNTVLVGAFALAAMVLAVVGLYGVIAYSVNRRTHEMGLRMALGAQRGDILRLVFRQGLQLGALGTGIGLAGAYALTRYLESLLFGVTATDLVTYVAAPTVLLGVALLACYLPARRAARIDPMVALRYE